MATVFSVVRLPVHAFGPRTIRTTTRYCESVPSAVTGKRVISTGSMVVLSVVLSLKSLGAYAISTSCACAPPSKATNSESPGAPRGLHRVLPLYGRTSQPARRSATSHEDAATVRITALALSREDPAVTNQHQPTERNAGGFVGSSAELGGAGK